MPEQIPLSYDFAEFRLDVSQRTLSRHGEPVTLTAKVFDTLLLLVQNSGRIVEKNVMMNSLWPESFVEEGNLSQNISVLRRILGDDRNGHSFIETIPRRGYKFVVPVRRLDVAAAESDSGSLESQAAAAYWSRHSPFRGLQVFEPEDAWLFFGRDTDTSELCDCLRRSPVLVVVGNSGSGKSSLVRAGLIPALRQGPRASEESPVDSWRVVLFRPSASPFDYLSEVLPGSLAPDLSLAEQTAFIADCKSKLPAGGDALRNAISALANMNGADAPNGRVLLVADQFEEIFTLSRSYEVRARYIEALLAASRLDSAVPVHLVLVLRADFYAHCLEHEGLSRCLAKNLYNVARITPERLHAGIERRLALAGAKAEAGLVDTLIADVGSDSGNLALLEHALSQLWKSCGGFAGTLTNRAYEEIGRIRGALSKHADEIYGSLCDESQRRLARRIFLELVHLGEGAQDTGRRLRKDDLFTLGDPEDLELLLAYLASSRLISTGGEGQEAFVEIAHEALIREWSELREWLAQNREELTLERRLLQAAQDWQGLNHDPETLLHGVRLAQAEEWLARCHDALPMLRLFIHASVEARSDAAQKEREAQARELTRQLELRQQAEARADAEKKLREQQEIAASQARRSASRLRWLLFAIAALTLVIVGATLYVRRQRLLSEATVLAIQSEQVLPRDHARALDLAIKSWRTAGTDEGRLALAKAFPERLATFKHDARVQYALFSPDGERVVTASSDHTARVWGAVDGHLIATLKGHTDRVLFAQFSPDGQRIVTASSDHTVIIWDSANGHPLVTLRGHTDEVICAQFSPDGHLIASTSNDRTIRVWSSVDGRLVTTLSGPRDQFAAQFSPDGKVLITAGEGNTVRAWSITDGRLVTTFSGHEREIVHAAFSMDGRQLLTASRDRTVRLWDTASGRQLDTIHHGSSVTYAAFSPDGRRVLTTGIDNTTRVWRSADGRLLATLIGHTATVRFGEFSHDGRYIFTASDDLTSAIWNSASGAMISLLQHGESIAYGGFSPDDRFTLTSSEDNSTFLWNNAAVHLGAILQTQAALSSASFSPDGRYIATTSGEQTARIWDSSDGHLLITLKGLSSKITSAQFSPDGQRIVTFSDDRVAQIWKSSDGALQATLQNNKIAITGAQFSPDSQRIVTVCDDLTARVWNISDGNLLTTLRGHSGTVRDARFSPEGQRIVTTSDDRTARIWNSIDGILLITLEGHRDAIRGARFSPDGKRLVTFSDDLTARIWQSADGHLIATLQTYPPPEEILRFSLDGNRIKAYTPGLSRAGSNSLAPTHFVTHGLGPLVDLVFDAQFSPDGSRILTSGADLTARIWSSSDGRLLETLEGAPIFWAQFSPDGQWIATSDEGQKARVWDSTNGRLLMTFPCPIDHVQSETYRSFSVAIVGKTGPVRVPLQRQDWNSAAIHNIAEILRGESYVCHSRFSPDGRHILAFRPDSSPQVLDIFTLSDMARIMAE